MNLCFLNNTFSTYGLFLGRILKHPFDRSIEGNPNFSLSLTLACKLLGNFCIKSCLKNGLGMMCCTQFSAVKLFFWIGNGSVFGGTAAKSRFHLGGKVMKTLILVMG